MARWRAGERHPEAGGRVSGSDVWRGSEERRSLLLEEGQHFVKVGVAGMEPVHVALKGS